MRHAPWLVAACLGVGGCASILGLDEFTDQNTTSTTTGSGGTTSTSGGGQPDQGGAGGSGTGGDGGAPPTGECNVGNEIFELASDDQMNVRRLRFVTPQINGQPVAIVAVGTNQSGGTPARAMVVSMRDENSIVVETWDAPLSAGSVEVAAIAMKSPTELIVYARVGNQVGELRVPIGNQGVEAIPAGAFTPYSLPTGCTAIGNFPRELSLREPIDPDNPKAALVCSESGPNEEVLYIGPNAGVFSEVARAPNGTAGMHVGKYLRVDDRDMILAGDDPLEGAFARLGPDFDPAIQIFAEDDRDRATTNFTAIPNEDGSAKVFVATLENPGLTPAKLFVRNFGGAQLPMLGTSPVPGLKQIAELEQIGDFVLWEPLVRSDGFLFGAGGNLGDSQARFTWLQGDGDILVRNLLVHEPPDGSIDAAGVAALDFPTLLVGWVEDGASTVRLRAKALTCIGGN